jgi:hypothetical protein
VKCLKASSPFAPLNGPSINSLSSMRLSGQRLYLSRHIPPKKKKGRALIIFETEDQQGRGEKKALHFKIITTREKTQKKERKKAIELLI